MQSYNLVDRKTLVSLIASFDYIGKLRERIAAYSNASFMKRGKTTALKIETRTDIIMHFFARTLFKDIYIYVLFITD